MGADQLRNSRARQIVLSVLIMIGIWQLGERLASAASCNAVVTVNPTKKWLWITIYDLGKIRQLDWGFVAPASAPNGFIIEARAMEPRPMVHCFKNQRRATRRAYSERSSWGRFMGKCRSIPQGGTK